MIVHSALARNTPRHAVAFQAAYDALNITKHARTLTWHTQDSGDFTAKRALHITRIEEIDLAVFSFEKFYGKLISLFFLIYLRSIRTLVQGRTAWFNREFAHILWNTNICARYVYRYCVSVNERERLRPTCSSMWLTRWKSYRSLLSARVVSLALFLSFLSSPTRGASHSAGTTRIGITFGKVPRHCRLSLDSPPDKSGDREHLYILYLPMHILRKECHATRNNHEANRITADSK